MNIQYTQESMEDSIKKFVNSINSQKKFISMLKPAFGNCNIETKELTLKFHVDEWMLNPQNALHGGITTAIFDTTFGYLAHYFSENRFVTTITLTTNYLKPIWLNDDIEVTGRIVSLGKNIVNLIGEIKIPERNVVAGTATASFMILQNKYYK